MGEEGSAEHHINRQAGGTRHEGNGKHREQAGLAVGDGACGHHGGNVASKAHQHGHKGFSVQTDAGEEGVGEHGSARQLKMNGALTQETQKVLETIENE